MAMLKAKRRFRRALAALNQKMDPKAMFNGPNPIKLSQSPCPSTI